MPTKIELMKDFQGRPLPANSERFGRPVYQWQVPCDRCSGSGLEPDSSALGGRCRQCGGDAEADQVVFIPLWSDEELMLMVDDQGKIPNGDSEKARKCRERFCRRVFSEQIRAVEICGGYHEKTLRGILSTIARTGRISHRQFSAVMQIGAEKFQPHCFGVIGSSMELELHCIKRPPSLTNMYHDFYRHVFVDHESRIVAYYSQKFLCNAGDLVKIKAKIKGHGRFRGQKETIIEKPVFLGVWKQLSGTEDWDWCPEESIFDAPAGDKQYRSLDGRLWDL